MPAGDEKLSLVCPDLAAMMGFCEDCYRLRVRIVWPYLTCLYENIRNSLFFWHVSFNNENQLGS